MIRNILECPEIRLSYKPRKVSNTAVTSSLDAVKLMFPCFKECMQHHEECQALYLDRQAKVIGRKLIGVGGIDMVCVDVRMIMQPAILHNANSIILFHNHPSGSPLPGEADESLTKQIDEAARLFNMKLLDHIVLSANSYYSFMDKTEHTINF